MAGPARPASTIPAAARRTGLRQPTRRGGSAVPDRMASPAVMSRPPSSATTRAPKQSPEQSGTVSKRKERDYEREINEDTSIHVVVRCRGRNEREIKENSGVVLSTKGVSGTDVDLSMGPNALSNKTYAFDKVFSPAADQTIVFDEVVLPTVNEVSYSRVQARVRTDCVRCSRATTVQFSRTARQGRVKLTPCLEI